MQNLNEKLPPLFPSQLDSYGKFSSENYQELNVSSIAPQPTLPQPLNIQQPFYATDFKTASLPKQILAKQHENHYVDVGHHGRKDWLAWSFVSLVIFFPLFIFWIPALICSVSARNKFLLNDIDGGKKQANIALVLNILCVIFACIGYLSAIIIPLALASKSCEENICLQYCNFIKTKYICYENYEDYVHQLNPLSYHKCDYSFYSGNYLCKGD